MKMKSKLTIFLTPSFFTSNSSWTRHSRIFLSIKTSTNQLMFVHRHWFVLENEQGSWPTVSAECSIIYSFLPQDHTSHARKAIPSEWNIISYRSSIPQYSSSRMIGARGFVILQHVFRLEGLLSRAMLPTLTNSPWDRSLFIAWGGASRVVLGEWRGVVFHG